MIFVGLGDMIYADSTCNEIGKYGNRQISGDLSNPLTSIISGRIGSIIVRTGIIKIC